MTSEQALPKVGSYEFLVEPFHCDFSSHLFPGHLGNGMLNAADYHSRDRGYGVAALNLIHRTWVLSRFAIEILESPKAYDNVLAETWVETAKKFFTSRNFAVLSPDGSKPYAYGRSIWAMIDTDTRQPADIFSIKDGLLSKYIETDKPCPIDPPSRVVLGHDLTLARKVVAQYNDVDVNGHVNSVKYIDHVLDLFSLDYYKSHRLRRLDIAYVAESHAGDTLCLYTKQTVQTEDEEEYVVRMTKESREEKDNEVEIVRCKVKFVKD